MSRLTSVMKLPKLFTFVLVASIVLCTVGSVYALSIGARDGRWPKSWPKELEPLRKQSWTIVYAGLELPKNENVKKYDLTTYLIPFANREEFESAWPHILKLKSKGAPVTLLRGPHIRVATAKTAGVRILSRPGLAGERAPGGGVPKSNRIEIELVVDGDIVDLNRIPLPADTPIIDKRFTGRKSK